MKGLIRDQIAEKNGLSGGTVTNIIREWSAGLHEGVAEELREFALALRKLKITAPRSAVGARVAYMMSKIGLEEEAFYSFMSQTYDGCIKLGLQPERISHDLRLMTDLTDSIPWDQIPAHIEKQIVRLQHLEKEIQRLESVEAEANKRLEMALQEEAVTKKVLDEFSDFTREMNRIRIPMANLPAIIKIINDVRDLGYDAYTIISKISDFEKIQIVEKELKDSVDFLTKKKAKLESDCQFFGSKIDVHSQTLAKYEALEDMGFGLKEQKILWHKIREIGVANRINPKESVQKFLRDVDEDYDSLLGFDLKIQKSKSELQINAMRIQNMSSNLDTQFQNNEKIKQFMSNILGTQIEQLMRVSEFSVLTQAAKGEMVAINELKLSLRKATEMVLGKLDPNDNITKVLENTRLELEKIDEPRSIKSDGESDIWT
ncbi:MAG TPA: hypothetical protein VFI73_08935 [Candidatus Nitrosopolaris sp.]|nr:hypothetical protein [Candidatus Nitrosopolaris sp.]